MKRHLLLLLMLLPLVASAYDAYIDGIYYNFSGNEATVTYGDTDYDSYYGSVVIPESITLGSQTYRVTSIGYHAFCNCYELYSISIPKSITFIGKEAFLNCEWLEKVIISDIAAWCGVTFDVNATANPLWYAHHIFSNESTEIKQLVIPSGVTKIKFAAFCNCSSLTSITIPSSVTAIYEYAFYQCTNLTNVSFSNNVTTMGNDVFTGTAWYNNQPNGLIYIGKMAYKYKGTMPSGTSIAIKDGTLGIASFAFADCSGLTSITFPSSVKFIGIRAFQNCSNLTSLPLPNALTTIQTSLCEGCTNLESINIPTSLKRIRRGAFKNCTSLNKIIVTNIAAWCGIEYEGNAAGDFPLYYAKHLYRSENYELTSVSIPSGVTRIEPLAFRDAKYITSITLPNNLTYIGREAFRGMHRLTSINIPTGITSIEPLTFQDCLALPTIRLQNKVTNIGDSAFHKCYALSTIYIRNRTSDMTIGKQAFYGTSADVYCYANNVPTTASDAFENSNIDVSTLYVPAVSVASYKATAPWSGFGSIVPVDEEVIPDTLEIASALDLKNFAARVNAGETSLCAKLTADIDFTAYPSVIIGSNSDYLGDFDGAGHSIKLAQNRTTENAGLFCYLSGYVHDLTTTGTITTSKKYAGGIAASTRKATIERCQSRVKIISSVNGDGTHGGIVGITHLGTIINDCLFSGSITGSQTNKCGGAAGWADGMTYISNCLVIGDITVSTTNSDKLCRCSSNVNSTNNYFQGGWNAANNCNDVTLLTENQVKSGEACYKLNADRTGNKQAWYQTLGEDDFPVPDNRHLAVKLVDGVYVNVIQYTITFDTNGGSPIESITQFPGTEITPPEDPTREGYTFTGWKPAIPQTMPENDLTCVAQWQANNYTITYMVDGNVYKTSSIAFGTELTPEPAPTKEGYTFSGWSYIPPTMPAEDIVVMGSFTINSYTLTYMVDGEEYKTSTVAYGSAITPEAEPTKEGYTFSGWSEIPETMPAEDVVITGTFAPNSYTLSYIVDGEEYKTSSLAYGTTITPEAEPTKEGYTFSGWSEIPATMPAEDVVITGSFTINQYLLTYIIDGEEYKSYNVDYNTTLTPEPAPVKRGMTFSGWGEMPETMPAYDLTLTGTYSWSKETVDGVTYEVADTLNNYASVIGAEGEEITILSDVEIGGDVYEVYSIAENALPKTITIHTSIGRLLLWLWMNDYTNVMETETGRILAAPKLSLVGTTASSLKMSFTNEYPELTETVKVSGSAVEKGTNGYEIALTGLEPDYLYDDIASVTLTFEDASYTKSYSFRTEPLTLIALQPKVVSIGNVIVVAESNLDDDEANVGFEWRRIDWTDDFESRSGAAFLYEGIMEGYIRSLNADKLWKFRPYYTSNAGNTYYSDWKGMDPSDYSFFEPTVHTYAPIEVTDSTAVVKGYAMQGTDDVASQGFIYWKITSPASSRRNVNGVPEDAVVVEVPGHVMKTTLSDLEYDTEYCFAAFVKTESGEIFYGEQQSFRTNSDPDGIKDIEHSTLNIEEAWYSLDGKKLGKPQKGINIIRYSDGTTRKVLIK